MPSHEMTAMIRAARRGAASLSRDAAALGALKVEEKAPSDYVSSADLRSQEKIRAELAASFPDHVLFMEEGTQDTTPAAKRLLVDPLDGTTNFLHGIAQYAIAIAREVDGEVVAGLVFDVAKDELFWAEKGAGAWLGDRRLRVTGARDLAGMVVATGVPHRGSMVNHERYLAALANVMREVSGIRRFGSAALDLAYVAAGRFDAFFELALQPWDVAAGSLIVREAGGVVTRCDGQPMALADRSVLAAPSAEAHATLVELLAPVHDRALALVSR